MLNFMRRAASTWVAKILLGLLVVSFGIWGASDFLSNAGKRGVASVGGILITPNQYAQAFQDELNRRNRNGKASLDSKSAMAMGIDRQVLQRLVYQEMLSQAAKRMGLRVNDEEVAKAIRALPVFQGDLGFDRLTFQQVLAQMNMTESQFADLIRGDTARQALLNSMLAPVKVPTAMINLYYAYQTEQRSLNFFQIQADKMKVDAPSDDDLQAYYKAHPNQFMAPEYRSFTSVQIRAEDLKKKVDISDEDLKKAYEQSAAQYVKPETRTISQIVLPKEDEAKALYEKIKGGMSFADAAREAGKNPKEISLGDMTLDQMESLNKDVAAAAFAPKKPTVTAPVKSQFGWHILDITKITPSSTKPFDEVKDQVRDKLAEDRVVDDMFEISNKAQDALSGGATVEEVAMKFDLPLVKTPLIDEKGFGPDGVKVKDAPSQEVIDRAFATQQNAYPELKETKNKDFLLVRVDDVQPATLRAFDTVQEKVRQAVMDQRRTAAAAKLAGELKAKAEKGESLKDLAEASDLGFRQVADIGRNGRNAPAIFGQATMQALFSAPRNGVFDAVGSAGHDYVVGRVTGIKHEDPSKDLPGTTQLTEVLKQVISDDIMAQYEQALNTELDVKIYPQLAREAIDPDAQP